MGKKRIVVHTTNGQHQVGKWEEDLESMQALEEILSEHGLKKFDQLSLILEDGCSIIHFNTDHVLAVQIETQQV